MYVSYTCVTSRYSFPANDTDPLHISPARTINECNPPKPGNGFQRMCLWVWFFCPPHHFTALSNLHVPLSISIHLSVCPFPPFCSVFLPLTYRCRCGGGNLIPFYLCVNKCVKAMLHLFFFFTGVCYKLNYIALQSARHAVNQGRYEMSSLWTYLLRCCVFASLTCAGHGARVGLGAVETLFAGALHGLFLRRRAVRRTLGAVGVRGRRFVGAGSAR